MKATHRVRNKQGKTVGFIIDGQFYNTESMKNNIELVDNLTKLKNGTIKSKRGKLKEIQLKQYNLIVYRELLKENPFKREIEDDFIKWKNDESRKVLRVNGPRQVGKTTEILKFGYNNYEQVIYVNLQNNGKIFLEEVISSQRIPLELTKYCRKFNLPEYIDDDSTLLIVDEIQLIPKVYNSIRLLKSQLKCDIVVTGSYLGRIFNSEFFHPAGQIDIISLRTLSFREFCSLFKASKILDNLDLYGKDSPENYELLNKLYNIYRQIGGYPDVVKKYIETKSVESALGVMSSLMEVFKEESMTYFKDVREVEIFNGVYRAVAQIMCTDKKGTGNHTLKDINTLVSNKNKTLVSKEEVSKAVSWVHRCGIIGTCNLVNNGDIRDVLYDRRIYFTDCGLANYVLQNSGYDKSNIDGVLTENFVYCELQRVYDKVKGLVDDRPMFSVYGNYELDFMIVDKNNNAVGIEIKTQNGAHKSLNVYLDKKLINRGIVAKPGSGGHSEKFDTIPIFAVGCRYPYKVQ